MGIPNFGNLAIPVRAAAKMLNIPLIVPPVTERTIFLGTRYSPEFACLPFKTILGTFIESLELGADTLFMITSFDACRMGYYAKVQEQVLRDLGYKFEMFKFKSSEKGITGVLRGIKRLSNDAPWFTVIAAYRLGIAKLNALDSLEQEVQKIRAVELERGMAERTLQEAARAIDEADRSCLKQVIGKYFAKLSQIPRDRGAMPLKVGIVGELFVVVEPFSNMNLEIELGKLGVEVKRTRSTFLSEWTKFSAYLNVLDAEKKKLRKFALPYLKHDVGGHGLESVAVKVQHAKEYDGIIHLMPFTCMPEIVAQNVMLKTSEHIPVLTILCDEQMGKSNLMTRLEAFIDLLRWHRKRR